MLDTRLDGISYGSREYELHEQANGVEESF